MLTIAHVHEAMSAAISATLPREVKHQATDFLQNAQKDPAAFDMCLAELNSPSIKDTVQLWTLNTLIEHMSSVELQQHRTPEQLIRLKTELERWLDVSLPTALPRIRNKIAHLFVVVWRETFPQWDTFLPFLLGRLQLSRDNVDFFLRVMQAIDTFIVDRALNDDSQRTREVASRIKDALREDGVDRIFAALRTICLGYLETSPTPTTADPLVQLALEVAGLWIAWVDVDIPTAPEWISVFYGLLRTPHAPSSLSAVCDIIVKRNRRDPVKKLSTLQRVGVGGPLTDAAAAGLDVNGPHGAELAAVDADPCSIPYVLRLAQTVAKACDELLTAHSDLLAAGGAGSEAERLCCDMLQRTLPVAWLVLRCPRSVRISCEMTEFARRFVQMLAQPADVLGALVSVVSEASVIALVDCALARAALPPNLPLSLHLLGLPSGAMSGLAVSILPSTRIPVATTPPDNVRDFLRHRAALLALVKNGARHAPSVVGVHLTRVVEQCMQTTIPAAQREVALQVIFQCAEGLRPVDMAETSPQGWLRTASSSVFSGLWPCVVDGRLKAELATVVAFFELLERFALVYSDTPQFFGGALELFLGCLTWNFDDVDDAELSCAVRGRVGRLLSQFVESHGRSIVNQSPESVGSLARLAAVVSSGLFCQRVSESLTANFILEAASHLIGMQSKDHAKKAASIALLEEIVSRVLQRLNEKTNVLRNIPPGADPNVRAAVVESIVLIVGQMISASKGLSSGHKVVQRRPGSTAAQVPEVATSVPRFAGRSPVLEGEATPSRLDTSTPTRMPHPSALDSGGGESGADVAAVAGAPRARLGDVFTSVGGPLAALASVGADEPALRASVLSALNRFIELLGARLAPAIPGIIHAFLPHCTPQNLSRLFKLYAQFVHRMQRDSVELLSILLPLTVAQFLQMPELAALARGVSAESDARDAADAAKALLTSVVTLLGDNTQALFELPTVVGTFETLRRFALDAAQTPPDLEVVRHAFAFLAKVNDAFADRPGFPEWVASDVVPVVLSAPASPQISYTQGAFSGSVILMMEDVLLWLRSVASSPPLRAVVLDAATKLLAQYRLDGTFKELVDNVNSTAVPRAQFIRALKSE